MCENTIVFLIETVQEAKNEIVTSGYNAGDEFPDEQKQKEGKYLLTDVVYNTILPRC